jgi:3-hydroxybutyryl-CoA dehydrogenase
MIPPPFARVGIIGAGTMGFQIALRCATFGIETRLFSLPIETVDQVMQKSRAWLSERVKANTLSAPEAEVALSRLHPCSSLEQCVANSELVIEVVPEVIELKREVFSEIDRSAPPSALIATGSSSIPSSRIASATRRPDQILNLHFPHVRDGVPVEVMGNAETSSETLTKGAQFVQSLGMLPIPVKREIMGFGMNTIWHEIKKTALRVVAEGVLDFEDIDRAWLLVFGPLPPFAHMDLVGLDVVRDIEMQYYRASGDERDKPPKFLEEWVAQGRVGVKSGRGFYSYPAPEFKRPGWLQKELPWTPDQTLKIEV